MNIDSKDDVYLALIPVLRGRWRLAKSTLHTRYAARCILTAGFGCNVLLGAAHLIRTSAASDRRQKNLVSCRIHMLRVISADGMLQEERS